MKVGVIGCGTMGEIFLRGFSTQAEKSRVSELYVWDKHPEKLEFAEVNYNARACKGEMDLASKAQVIFLCLKPKDIMKAVQTMAPTLRSPKILVSIAAGVGFKAMSKAAAPFDRIVRLMPNTPCLVRQGAMGIWFSDSIPQEERAPLVSLVTPLGQVTHISNENVMDVVTATSGSGPAYVYYLANGLIEGAIRNGMEPETARKLVVQTIRGTSELLEGTNESMEELIRKVQTPGGTTEAALTALNQQNVTSTLVQAISNAVKRGRELAKG